jgi:hypothetical protein
MSSQAGRGQRHKSPRPNIGGLTFWLILAPEYASSPRGLYGRDGKRTARKSHYRLADEPSPLIEVACSKCEWKGAFSRAELLAMYGAECPLPTLLNHLAMPGCSKIDTHWDRCGVYYVNPIDGRER